MSDGGLDGTNGLPVNLEPFSPLMQVQVQVQLLQEVGEHARGFSSGYGSQGERALVTTGPGARYNSQKVKN